MESTKQIIKTHQYTPPPVLKELISFNKKLKVSQVSIKPFYLIIQIGWMGDLINSTVTRLATSYLIGERKYEQGIIIGSNKAKFNSEEYTGGVRSWLQWLSHGTILYYLLTYCKEYLLGYI